MASATASTRLRVAMVAPPWFPMPPGAYGGIEWMIFWLVEGLTKRGHDVTLVGADDSDTSARYVRTYEKAPSERLGEPFPEVVHAAAVGGTLRDGRFDVVHDNSLAGPLLAFGRSTPTVVTAHGPVDGEIGEYYRLLREVVAMVAISDAQRRIAPDLSWVATVYNCIPVEQYPMQEDKEDFLVWLGRMNPEKAPHLAIDAARRVGMRIVLAGKCSEPAEERYFEAEIAPRLGDGVEWTGEADTERKKDLLCRARCFVFPIRWEEPFGIVMVEAMACGTPVVALRAGSVPEVVVDGVTGFVCDSPEELPGAIERIGEIDPSACRDHVVERFGVDAMVAGYEEVYLELAAGERVT
ncbi:MAG: glycosyltransferase family 4 protein [Actinomycetota bacterium]